MRTWQLGGAIAGLLVLLSFSARAQEDASAPESFHGGAAAGDSGGAGATRVPAAAREPTSRYDAMTTGLFVAAELGLALDLLQTLDIKHHPFNWETNPLLGRHPSDGVVMAYFGTIMAVEAATYFLAPRKVSRALSAVTLMVQVPMVAHNWSMGMRVRF